MAAPRPFRFGMQLSNASAGDEWRSLARQAEDLGYSTLFLPDHFGDQLAPLPAMMAAADATTTLRVGALVHDNDYKHPVVLAKEIATVDVLSGGRVEFGIGAGWMNTDYEQSGIPKDRDGVRIARMAEALEIYKGMWADGPFSFSGEHYEITGLDGLPKPVQRPGPPILIGGGGPKVLGIAGRHADIVGINPALPAGEVTLAAGPEMLAEAVDRKLGYVRDAAGDRFEQIELNVLVFFGAVTDNRAAQVTNYAGLLGMEPEDFEGSPYFAFFGSVEEIADNVRAARERWGISYYCFQPAAMEEMAPVVALLAGT
ncbi:MAG: TIGR03621 family F420-dependent LLM class oxidoreductase [Acidimicrobiales bacterium]